MLIEKKLHHIADAALKWALRRRAKEIVPAPPPKTPRAKVVFSAPRMGMRFMIVTGTERDITDIETSLRTDLDPTLPESEQMLGPLLDVLRSDTTGIPRAAPRPIVLVPMEEHVKILAGDGDEVLLGLTDGTTMTGAEYLQRTHGEALEVALFHPEEGPINLYRSARFANQKQRDLLRVAQPVCSAPDCRRAADTASSTTSCPGRAAAAPTWPISRRCAATTTGSTTTYPDDPDAAASCGGRAGSTGAPRADIRCPTRAATAARWTCCSAGGGPSPASARGRPVRRCRSRTRR